MILLNEQIVSEARTLGFNLGESITTINFKTNNSTTIKGVTPTSLQSWLRDTHNIYVLPIIDHPSERFCCQIIWSF